MSATHPSLHQLIQDEIAKPYPETVNTFVDMLRCRHPAAIAVLFYGSCLWNFEQQMLLKDDQLFDFYVIVPSYRQDNQSILKSVLNWLLPPNVYYVQTNDEEKVRQAKYALISIDQFRKGASGSSLQPAIWARFSQPVRLVFLHHEHDRPSIVQILSQAVTTMICQTVPLLGSHFTPHDIWVRAFQETYKAEIRVEKTARIIELYRRSERYYQQTALAILGNKPANLNITDTTTNSEVTFIHNISYLSLIIKRYNARLTWLGRRIAGKFLNFMRLIKALFTFQDAVAYAVWKMQRHTGQKINIPAWCYRYPVLAIPVFVWRYYQARHRQQSKIR